MDDDRHKSGFCSSVFGVPPCVLYGGMATSALGRTFAVLPLCPSSYQWKQRCRHIARPHHANGISVTCCKTGPSFSPRVIGDSCLLCL